MNFLNPLGFIAMVAVPLLVMLYFLKLKRPEIRVSSTLLWQKVIEDMRVNSPFQRLKRSLLLLIQLLLLLALIFALTRPFRKGAGLNGTSLIVLVDTSASMAAIEPDGRTRLDHAKDRLEDLIDGLSGGEEIMIVAYDNQARQTGQFSSNKRRLREAVDSLTTSERPTDLTQALILADSMAVARNSPRILVLSDGAFPDPHLEIRSPLEFEIVGSDRPNLAITSLDIRRGTRDRNKVELFVAVQNFTRAPADGPGTPITGRMNVYLDGKLLDAKPVSIDPEKSHSAIYDANLPAGGEMKVEFEVDDALAADNVAYQVIAPPEASKILIVGDQTYYLDKVFGSADVENFQKETIAPNAYTPDLAEGRLAVIWNMVEKPGTPATNNLYIGCVPDYPGLAFNGEVNAPLAQDWDNVHPTTRYLDFKDLRIGSAAHLELPDEGHVILRSGDHPLIAEVPRDKHLLTVVAFNPYNSNWPLLVSYPVFLLNTMAHFEQNSAAMSSHNIRVGDSITLAEETVSPVIARPDGTTVELQAAGSGIYSYGGVDISGIYRVTSKGEAPQAIAANMFNFRESNLAIDPAPLLANQAVATVNTAEQVDKEWAKYLLIAAVVLLLLEWLVYHKRIFT